MIGELVNTFFTSSENENLEILKESQTCLFVAFQETEGK